MTAIVIIFFLVTPPAVVLILGLCKISADADRRMEEILRKMHEGRE